MAQLLEMLNNVAVTIFGCVLSAAFCGMGRTAQSRKQIMRITASLLVLQGLYCIAAGTASIRTVYPVLTHLPLAVLLSLATQRKLWACGGVFLAYLCCQLRRWLALLVLAVLPGGDIIFALIEIVITAPILWCLLRYVAPTAREIAFRPLSIQVQFCMIPVLYYLYDYLTVVYTDWLYSGAPAAVEFMPFVFCAAYLLFLLRACVEERKFSALERDRDCLNLQVSQSVRELEVLREAQLQSATYRHDLRHHLQYLSGCIENGDYAQAQDYIRTIDREIDAQKVVPYCENEAVNLVLSAYAGRAAKAGVEMDVRVIIGANLRVSVNDLCVLLSNGMENALHACTQLPEGSPQPKIQVRGYEKGGKLYLQIANPCPMPVTFEDGVPVTREHGHGVGTRSIQTIVQRYGGLCSFTQENGQFLLRTAI